MCFLILKMAARLGCLINFLIVVTNTNTSPNPVVAHYFVYTEFVRNVTISLPEAVWEALRDRAKDHRKSLNAFIGEILARETSGNAAWLRDFEAATESHAVTAQPWEWNREDTYANRLS